MMNSWLRWQFQPLLAAAAMSAGCWDVCDSGKTSTGFECRQTGSVKVTITPPLELSSPPQVLSVGTCHGSFSTCGESPRFSVGNFYKSPGDEALYVYVTLPAGGSTGTIILPSPNVLISASLRRIGQNPPDALRRLNVVSGTITVETSKELRFTAAFEMVLETEEGQQVSLTQGRASADDCKLHEVCAGG
jgi:hypothetical protein